MLEPRNISIFLNNALKSTPALAELESDTALPDAIRDMPDHVAGHFVGLDEAATHDIAAAWKRVMILNPTQVLYTFTFDSATGNFTANKR
ncbi:MAG TPA: hypothetical protein VGH38_00725 [Bryobacteraceae bacterium]|jgi:hypothetical protein